MPSDDDDDDRGSGCWLGWLGTAVTILALGLVLGWSEFVDGVVKILEAWK